jgi:hypothetical protein
MNNKTLHRKQKIKQHETTRNGGWTHVLLKSKQFLLRMWYPWFYFGDKPVDQIMNEENMGL